ncbi:hypothetical protein CBL_13645 [Carabus blaptoides fortunei]
MSYSGSGSSFKSTRALRCVAMSRRVSSLFRPSSCHLSACEPLFGPSLLACCTSKPQWKQQEERKISWRHDKNCQTRNNVHALEYMAHGSANNSSPCRTSRPLQAHSSVSVLRSTFSRLSVFAPSPLTEITGREFAPAHRNSMCTTIILPTIHCPPPFCRLSDPPLYNCKRPSPQTLTANYSNN